MARPLHSSARSFTIVELALVLAIFATFGLIAAPRYQTSLINYRIEAAANRVIADLHLARQSARGSGSSRTMTFGTPANGYTITNVQALDGPATDYSVDLAGDPYRAVIVSASFGGDNVVVFDAYGIPDSAGTVVLQVGDRQITVGLDANTAVAEVQ